MIMFLSFLFTYCFSWFCVVSTDERSMISNYFETNLKNTEVMIFIVILHVYNLQNMAKMYGHHTYK